MATPLMMLGPGGNYVTRFDVKGSALVKSRVNSAPGYDPDAESAGTMSAWARLRRRRKDVENPGKTAPLVRPADCFEHTEPAAPATYAPTTPGQLQQRLALIQAAEQWMDGQLDAVDDLASAQTQVEAVLAHAGRPEPTVRVIRWNGSTMTLPRPIDAAAASARAGRPLPEHAFTPQPPTSERRTPAPNPDTASGVLKTETQPHDHAQSHAQADEDPHHDPRLAADPWLFPDHAGVGRRARRLQGHGLRARRGAHQKGMPGAGCEQSSLFGAVA